MPTSDPNFDRLASCSVLVDELRRELSASEKNQDIRESPGVGGGYTDKTSLMVLLSTGCGKLPCLVSWRYNSARYGFRV